MFTGRLSVTACQRSRFRSRHVVVGQTKIHSALLRQKPRAAEVSSVNSHRSAWKSSHLNGYRLNRVFQEQSASFKEQGGGNFSRGSVVTKTGSGWKLVNNSGCSVVAAMWAVSSELVNTSSLKKRGVKNETGGFSLRLTGFGQSLVQSVVHRSSQPAVTCIECWNSWKRG